MTSLNPRLDEFIARCEGLIIELDITRSTLSTKIFRDGKRLSEIVAGSDVGVRRLARAEEALVALERIHHGTLRETSRRS